MALRRIVDTFARDNLPPRRQWPDFLFDLPGAALSGAAELRGRAARPLGRGGQRRRALPDLAAETLTYRELHERVNRIANVLARDLGLVPGNRVLLRAANTPMMVAAYLAVLKAGGVVVATMPLLRAKELAYRSRRRRSGSRSATTGSPRSWRRRARWRRTSSASSTGAAASPMRSRR